MDDENRLLKTTPGLAGTVELAAKLRAALTPGGEATVSLEEAPDILAADLQALAAAHLAAARDGARLTVDAPAGGRLDAALHRAGFDRPTDAALARDGARWTGVTLLQGTGE